LSLCFDHAFATEFISPPSILVDATAARLEDHFNVHLTLAKAVSAIFGAVHQRVTRN
jgi:hypothetical protein